MTDIDGQELYGIFFFSIACSPPHEWPITATFEVSTFPYRSLPCRAFSAIAQSTASSSCDDFVGPET